MRLTDISLNWLLPGAVLLLGVLAAVAVLARGKRSKESTSSDDSWERSEERRRRKETMYATASYVLLFCCAAVAAALSFHGLVGFGQQNLGLTDGWEYLVPFGLDGAAMFCSVLAVREASHGDAALGSRILVWGSPVPPPGSTGCTHPGASITRVPLSSSPACRCRRRCSSTAH